jgi:RND superfamily putative drug exporter
MTAVDLRKPPPQGAPPTEVTVGPIGRLGRFAADHVRVVAVAWAVLAVGLGIFAPRAEHALSGAGWEASGSESVETRALVKEHFAGLSSYALMVVIHSEDATASSPAFGAVVDRVEATLRSSDDVASVSLPRRGVSISEDGRTAVVLAGAKGDPTEMVAAADDLKGELRAAGSEGIQVSLTGASGMWSDFNAAP